MAGFMKGVWYSDIPHLRPIEDPKCYRILKLIYPKTTLRMIGKVKKSIPFFCSIIRGAIYGVKDHR